MKLTVASARRLAADLLTAAGMGAAAASTTARCVILADVWGVASHGLLRLPYYLRRMAAGGYPPDAALDTVADNGPVIALEGGGGLGHRQLWRAAELATQRAARLGVAAVSVANSGHCGALGVYTIPGIEAGLITLAFSTGPAVMPGLGIVDAAAVHVSARRRHPGAPASGDRGHGHQCGCPRQDRRARRQRRRAASRLGARFQRGAHHRSPRGAARPAGPDGWRQGLRAGASGRGAGLATGPVRIWLPR